MKCSFKRKYIEPTKKYKCLSASLFITDKYIKLTYGNKRDVLDSKINLFIKNILQMAKDLLQKKSLTDYYYRIYYHNSVLKNQKLKKLKNFIEKHPKFQLIEYICSDNNLKDIHTNLFGTILRFHAIFDDESPNMTLVSLVDADNIITDNVLNEINKFIKSNDTILSFETLLDAPLYSYEYTYLPDVYFRAGTTTIIKDKNIFNMKTWNKYVLNMFNDLNLLKELHYLDFKKYTLFPETEEQSFITFEYGFDEILLNYILRKLIYKHDLKLKVVRLLNYRYKTFFISRIKLFLDYNKKRNKINYDIFIKKTNLKNLSNIKTTNFNSLIKVFKKHLNLMKKMYIQYGFIYFIDNYDKIKNKKFPNYSDYFISL